MLVVMHRNATSKQIGAVIVAGAHGTMIEVHPDPEKALSDGPQSLTIPGFEKLMEEIRQMKNFLGH